MSGSENPKWLTLFSLAVNHECCNQHIRNKLKKGLSLDAVSLKSLTVTSTVCRESSVLPVYVTQLHKSNLCREGFYQNGLNTISCYVLDTDVKIRVSVLQMWTGVIINNIVTSTMTWRRSSARGSDQFNSRRGRCSFSCRGLILEAG